MGRQNTKQIQEKHKYMQKRAAENAQRQARGEPALPDEDISKQFKPIAPLPRLDAMITSGQISNYCKNLSVLQSVTWKIVYFKGSATLIKVFYVAPMKHGRGGKILNKKKINFISRKN